MPADIPSRHPISNGRRWLSRSRCLVPSVAVATPCPGRSSGLHKGMSIARFGTRWMPSSNNAGLQISRHFILVAVRLRAYAGTLDSVPWYTAQCTGVRCPTYCCTPAQRTGIWMGHSVIDGYLFSDWIYGFSIITRLKRIRLLYSLLYNMYLLFLIMLREGPCGEQSSYVSTIPLPFSNVTANLTYVASTPLHHILPALALRHKPHAQEHQDDGKSMGEFKHP